MNRTLILGIFVLSLTGFLHSSNGSFYSPGKVRAAKGLRAPLTPPSQVGVEGPYWKVEEDILLYNFSRGEGTPVLVIHGGPGYPPSGPWPGLEALEKNYKLYYYHQRGCGKSTKPVDRFESQNYLQNVVKLDKVLGFSAQLADIERIRRILNQEKLIIIGHSWGGFMAALYAVEFPEHIQKMILVDPAGMLQMPVEGGLFEQIKALLPEEKHTEFDAFLKEYFDYSNIFKKSEKELMQISLEFAKFFGEAALSQGLEIPDMTRAETEMAGGWMVHAQYFSLGMKFDYRPELKKVKSPVLVIHGELDIIPASVSREYAGLFPAGSFHIIPKASHFPQLDQPDDFGNVVTDFLK